jgi:hypothetical protein
MEFVDVIEAGEKSSRSIGSGGASGATVDAEVGVIFDCDRGIIGEWFLRQARGPRSRRSQ